MEHLFTVLTHAVSGAPVIALVAALVWGVLSIVLSPCHLAGIPLIIGFISNQPEMTTRRAFWMATLFAVGMLVTIGVIGGATASLGRLAGDLGNAGRYLSYLVAVIFFLVGLHFLEVITLPFAGPRAIGMRQKGLPAALLLGLIFGIVLGPCTFAFMLPVLGATFTIASTAPVYAAGLLLAYGIGHCAVIVAAGTSTGLVQRCLHWNESARASRALKQVCGVLVLLGGLYLLYIAR